MAEHELFDVLGFDFERLNLLAKGIGEGGGDLPKSAPQAAAHMAQGLHDFGLPFRGAPEQLLECVLFESPASGRADPAAEEKHVHVGAAVVLKRDAGFGDPGSAIDAEREIPERMRIEGPERPSGLKGGHEGKP